MRISIFVYGTWGDIRPHVVLGQALQETGHEVQVIASPGYEAWVRERGLGYAPLSADVNTFSKENAHLMDQGIIQQLKTASELLKPIMVQMGLEVLEATRDTDVLMTVEFGMALLFDILRVNRLKAIVLNPAPLNITSEFPSAMPPLPNGFPFQAAYNRFTYRFVKRMGWMVMGGARNQIATDHLGLPKSKLKDYQQFLADTPALTTVSEHVVKRPADWPEHFQITGYLFDDDDNWEPPQDLVDFLAAGEKPVYIGFGSMPDSKPEATTRTLIEAVQQTGKRAVILTGWAGFHAENAPKNVHFLKYAPHSWLFPQMAAVVHHGGAGTTASGLRAGVPTVIVPHNGDQPYWGRHVQELGVGTAPIPRKKLTADRLAAAIIEATSDQMMREKASQLGQLISAEDGLSKTAQVTQAFLANF
ncbi:MAG: glycosyltransferase family 1 protein [Anaerolineaceae bacterium]|nr:glycosyltransferase family 1 protein [Anaerolineaceae bacterium]